SRFDEYHQVPFALRGHIPAIFYGQSVIIGVEQIRTASSSGWTIEELSPRQNPFPWARFADSLLFGICLMILAGMWDSS
ncbi:MAG: hypothetical protein AAGU32_02900, partial [Bacillota bacterium]